jgi:hypothetical protein
MWSTLAGGHLMKVVNLTGFTVVASKEIGIEVNSDKSTFVHGHISTSETSMKSKE